MVASVGGNFNIQIDPKNNKVKQILGARDPEYGVVSGSMIMDDKPTLGQWKIKVSTEGYTYQKFFKVAEYVIKRYQAFV
ncbi:hypothetical protein KUTeg_017297 [Tegillarca granosa]|uniref:Uncharacterized protein n=1 Tax=Tegillarca granosa TaxID=220873 RepID=A0ABQ9EMK9_TEGGR|nr:hypothetical protein KUTeg_017297 [Tegillarca granosa]